MNTDDIENILCSDIYTRPLFAGCFPSDAIDKLGQVDHPSAYVFNYDPGHEPGTHWVAIYFSQEGKGEYLDSYGIPPLIPGFYTFLEKNTVSWRFNDRTLQGPHSRVCGHYCVFYMLYRCRGRSMDSVVAMFDDDTNDNDDFVYRFISNL